MEEYSAFDLPHSAATDFSDETNIAVEEMRRPDNVNLDDEGNESEQEVEAGFPDFDWDALEGKLMT